MTIERKSYFYVGTIILPTFFILLICIFGLFMPTDNTGTRYEKVIARYHSCIYVSFQVSLGGTCLLSTAMTVGSATSDMPKAGQIPILGEWFSSMHLYQLYSSSVLCEVNKIRVSGAYLLATFVLCAVATATTAILSFIHERVTTR